MKRHKICKIIFAILAVFLCVAFYELIGICITYKKQPAVSDATIKETQNIMSVAGRENTERAVIIEKNSQALLERVVKNTAAAYDASVEINLTRATPPLVNNQDISNILKNSAVKLYGEEVVTKYEKTPGGEDFAYFTQVVPGALAFMI